MHWISTFTTEKPDDHEGFVPFDPEFIWIDLRVSPRYAIVEDSQFPHMSWVRLFQLLLKLKEKEADI